MLGLLTEHSLRVRDFRDLTVWQRSVDLAELIYRLTQGFPPEERYGMTAQLRRASVSVSSNIAEGNGRGSTPDYIRFLRNSSGSLNEMRSLTILSHRLGMAADQDVNIVEESVEPVSKMLASLRLSLSRHAANASR